jgi:ABC-2 type transport system ATP-binding protein
MIEVQGLTHRYGPVTAVRDLDLTVERGQLLGLLGPNGAGKTTTLRSIVGSLTPTSGRVLIDGQDVATHPMAARRKLGYLPENVSLYLELTVIEFLRFVGQAKGLGRSRARTEAERVIPLAGLEAVRNRVIGYCSRGYRQRIGLAQVLVGDPPALVLDEPTVGLDPAQIADVRGRIAELARDRAVILSTHILPEASRLCDRVLILHQGRCVGFDDLATLTQAGDSEAEVEIYLEGTVPREISFEGSAPFVLRSCEVEDGRRRLRLELGEGRATSEAVRYLVEAGHAVCEVRPRQAGLEEVFLHLVHEDPSPVAASGDPA